MNTDEPKMLFFQKTFANGVSCEFRVPDSKEPGFTRPILKWNTDAEIDRAFVKAIQTEYLNWMLTVYQELSDRWDARTLYVFSETKSFVFEPGKPVKLMPMPKL